MFEKLIADMVQKYLSDIFQDISPREVSVSVLAGHINLQKLRIRKDALFWLFPFAQVCSGAVGLINVQFNILKLKSSPIKVVIKDVVIVISLAKPEELDPDFFRQIFKH